MEHKDKPMFIGIDLIRCLAAFWVMIYHYLYGVSVAGQTPNRLTQGLITEPLLPSISAHGWMGVPAFFVISGLVIFASIANASAGQFLARRIKRLVPALWICATISLFVAVIAADGTLLKIIWRYIVSLTFFPFGRQIDGSYWTLRVEAGFYLSILLMLMFKRSALETYFRSLCLVSFLVHLASFAGLAKREPLGNIGDLLVIHHGCYFTLGIYLYKWLAQSDRSRTTSLFLLIALAGTYLHMTAGQDAAGMTFSVLVWSGIFACIVAALAFNNRLSARLPVKASPLVRHIGKGTYPFYLIHQLVGCYVIYLGLLTGLDHGSAAAVAVAVILVLTLAIVSAEPVVVRRIDPMVGRLAARVDLRATRQNRPLPAAAEA